MSRQRKCCDTKSHQAHDAGCENNHDRKLAAGQPVHLLVPWAIGKCAECGSTLVVDPLEHRCGAIFAHHEETIL